MTENKDTALLRGKNVFTSKHWFWLSVKVQNEILEHSAYSG